MNTLNNKKILLGVTGGIAAYKAADLVRRLREQGAQVQVVMTEAAKAFITPLTLQALSGNPVRENLWDTQAEAAMGHIELARWADWIIVAPASADFIARLNHGFANDLLTTLCLASAAPIVLAPAMNQQMWRNDATQANVKLLLTRGVQIIGPAEGSQACGEVGAGRMVEPLAMVEYLKQLLEPKLLDNIPVLMTAGPTQENIDAVRYLTNRSSGKMGFALAQALQVAGAHVTLISGPVQLPTPAQITRIDVQTAEQMQQAVLAHVNQCAIFIAAAAVADYRVAQPSAHKIKKTQEKIQLALERTPDILATVAHLKKPPFTIGFAAETDQVIDYAKTKLKQKKLNLIIANPVGEHQGFEVDNNEVTVIWPQGQQQLPLAPKKQIAQQLVKIIAERFLMTSNNKRK